MSEPVDVIFTSLKVKFHKNYHRFIKCQRDLEDACEDVFVDLTCVGLRKHFSLPWL